jgi:hypothetical protein
MSPFAIAVILILTVLFALLSLTPVLFGQSDVDTFDPSPKAKTKAAH